MLNFNPIEEILDTLNHLTASAQNSILMPNPPDELKFYLKGFPWSLHANIKLIYLKHFTIIV